MYYFYSCTSITASVAVILFHFPLCRCQNLCLLYFLRASGRRDFCFCFFVCGCPGGVGGVRSCLGDAAMKIQSKSPSKCCPCGSRCSTSTLEKISDKSCTCTVFFFLLCQQTESTTSLERRPRSSSISGLLFAHGITQSGGSCFLMIFSGLSGRRNYFQGVDLAMNTTTRTLLAVPVLSRSLGKDGGKVIAVSTCEGGGGRVGGQQLFLKACILIVIPRCPHPLSRTCHVLVSTPKLFRLCRGAEREHKRPIKQCSAFVFGYRKRIVLWQRKVSLCCR